MRVIGTLTGSDNQVKGTCTKQAMKRLHSRHPNDGRSPSLVIKSLLCAKHCTSHFMYIFVLRTNPREALLFSFYRQRDKRTGDPTSER